MSRRVITFLLIISHSVYLLPAQDFGIDLQRGKARLERYLDRAGQERSKDKWEEIASAGIEAALLEWESANIFIRDA